MIYYKHKDPSKNIGKTSGKKFVVMFDIKSYVLREDGSKELVKHDATTDLLTMMRDDGEELIHYFNETQIEW